MIISTIFLQIIAILISGLSIITGVILFFIKKNPVLRILISALATIFMLISAILLTSISQYDMSYFIDISVIYFILGFANFVLYFIFFNKRT
jgi:hypothetical protein